MKFLRLSLVMSVLCLLISGCGGRMDVDRSGAIKLRGERPVSLDNRRSGDLLQRGTASWYGNPFHGRKTSNGETYNMWALTAAHKTIPFGTWVRVVNRDNGREVRVRINDRGPFIRGRVIDLSRRAAESLDMIGSGTALVHIFLADDETAEPIIRPGRERPVTQTTTTHWTVQIASFRDPGKAVELADQLSSQFVDIRIEKAANYYRVRIGQFNDREAAEKLAQSLRREGYESWVTKKL